MNQKETGNITRDSKIIKKILEANNEKHPLQLFNIIAVYHRQEHIFMEYDYLLDVLKLLFENNEIGQVSEIEFYLKSNGAKNEQQFSVFSKDIYEDNRKKYTEYVNSLKKRLGSNIELTEKVTIYLKISDEYETNEEIDMLRNFYGNIVQKLSDGGINTAIYPVASPGYFKYEIHGEKGDDVVDKIHEIILPIYNSLKGFEGSYLTLNYATEKKNVDYK